MPNDYKDVRFSLPYELAVVRPLRQTTPQERAAALAAAHYNTELLPQDLIYIDLSTDSGVSALSSAQLALIAAAKSVEPGMGLGAEGSRAHVRLAEQVRRYFGFPFFIATTQGRSAERIWSKIHVKPNTVVAGNMLFPSTRIHIEMNGAKIADVIGDAAHDLKSDEPFKGNIDLAKLEALLSEPGAQRIGVIYVELSVNSCGGHPVSLANLKLLRQFATAHKIQLFLDACRILENSYLIQEREPGYRERPIHEIVAEICALADGCTLSALKDFMVSSGGLILIRDQASYQNAQMQSFLDGVQLSPSGMESLATALDEIFAGDAYVASRVGQVHYLWSLLQRHLPVLRPAAGHGVFIDVKELLPRFAPEDFPAEALAVFVYLQSGIRLTKGPPPAPSQLARGTELLRLAVPARRYMQGHMDDIAAALIYAREHANEIKRLRKVDDPARSKYDPAHFIQQ